MKLNQIIICLVLLTILIWLNQNFGAAERTAFGGLSWLGWTSMFVVLIGIGLVLMLNDSVRASGFFKRRNTEAAKLKPVRKLTEDELVELGISKYKGPEFPHPVIFTERCIGCQACVDACPHDVLAIVEGTAAVVAADQCMEDTACEAECPVNPKACIVINTTKEVRSRPSPTRDGATYQTNVPGCYIIGDVSGVPLIKNAVKEGAEVIEHISEELQTAKPEPKAEYDVAIIGIGPGGGSAAVTAQEKGLKYVGIEQEKILSTIQMYPKGKYIFFKPDTKDWSGGLKNVGLGLAKAKYDTGGDKETDESFETELKQELEGLIAEQTNLIRDELIPKIPKALHAELTPLLAEKTGKQIKKKLYGFLHSKGEGNWKSLYQTHFVPNKEEVSGQIRAEIADQLETKIPGDQRERILDVWMTNMAEKGVKINEEESCQAVNRAEDGDYFIVKTVRGAEKQPQTYKPRRVVLAIGLRGAPNKLRVPNEEKKFIINGKEENKVLYSLTNPGEYKGRHIIIVGGGNSAVEAAVDLVAIRDGSNITPRPPEEMNKVTLLVRSYFAPTVKFGNKLQLYQCFDDGILDVRFGVAIKELRDNEVVLEDVPTKKVIGTIPNDYVFALIGGERPDRFLQSIGIKIA
jgi:thioredoxin reductase